MSRMLGFENHSPRFIIALVFALTLKCSARNSDFERQVLPLMGEFCLKCHSAEKHKGDLNLEQFKSLDDVLKHPAPWQRVVEQLSLGEMPPKEKPQPTKEQREELIGWVSSALDKAALKNASDPGPVVLRRLNNAEYTYTVRDMTGVGSLSPAKEFPADSAAGEGFMNTGNTLVMSPALLAKYLDAAKDVASHAVLLPDGIRFSSSASRRDWTDEIVKEIRAYYGTFTVAGGADTITQQDIPLDINKGGRLPLEKYLLASLELRGGGKSLAAVAQKRSLSKKYLGLLVEFLKGGTTSPLLGGLRTRWQLAKPEDVPAMVTEIGEWQKNLWKFSSIGHIGKIGGPKAWMEPVSPLVSTQELRVKFPVSTNSNESVIYLVASDAGDGNSDDFVIWKEPKLNLSGLPPILLRDAGDFMGKLSAWRKSVLSSTAQALNAAAEAVATSGQINMQTMAEHHGLDVAVMRAWFNYLGIGSASEINVNLFTNQLTKISKNDSLNGWDSFETPNVVANSSDQEARIPGKVKPHGIVVHPTPKLAAAVGWRSPVTASMRIEATVTDAHTDCGNGVAWSLELRHGRTRRHLADGFAQGDKLVTVGPIENVTVQAGDMISIIIDPRDGDHHCDLTDLEFKLKSSDGLSMDWSLTRDVADNILTGNPHPDKNGHKDVWHFYSEPVSSGPRNPVAPAGSILARWYSAKLAGEKQELAGALQKLLTSEPPKPGSPDAALFAQLSSLASPLFSEAAGYKMISEKHTASRWGVEPALFGKHPNGSAISPANLCVQAPSIIEVKIPAELAAGAELVTSGALDLTTNGNGSVQLQLLATKPDAKLSLFRNAGPIIVKEGSAARKRIEASFDEFRQMFPAAFCYTKVVPVDEVITVTLFHREDEFLTRLVLDDAQKAKLDRMWDELHYISQDAITQVDVIEQILQFATQDGNKDFASMQEPIKQRAEEFKKRLVETQPAHLDAVVKFAENAYRRPLATNELGELRNLYRTLRAEEIPHPEAIRLTLARVLVSPGYLYRTEQPAPGSKPGPVNDWELATRLSYFLWSSMPDAELRLLASQGKLHKPDVLAAQAKRMLRDPRVRRLATEFACTWLHIHDFESLDEKSERHFPTFAALRGPMYEEAIRFFTDAFQNNASLLTIFDANHTFLNQSLAEHYGIPGVKGTEWRRVDDVRQFGRGGILGMGATLAKQSGASRTSPILRGNWIAEVLLGDKLPRPPKDVPRLPEDEATEKLTVRELTQKHTSDPRCAGCHARIDGFGFALEGYDAIGRARTRDLGDRPIDTRSKVFDGTTVDGAAGLREYLLTKKRDVVLQQFCRKLLGYSLGRGVMLSDKPLITEMQTQLRKHNYQFNAALDTIVRSKQFREIRGKEMVRED